MVAGARPGREMPDYWKPSLTSGVEPLDGPHKDLLRLIGDLVDAATLVQHDRCRALLAQFLAECQDHFALEERLMVEHGFPAETLHRGGHTQFLTDVRRMVGELERSGPTPGFKLWVQIRLHDWFVSHVKRSDLELGLHLGRGGPV